MSIARNRILSLALAICLLLGMTLVIPGPVSVQAADVEIEEGLPTVKVNETVIGFGGKEWYVIGYKDTGVEPDQDDYVILLAKNDEFGPSIFHASSHVYNGSDLYDKMIGIYQSFSEQREKDMVMPRDLYGVTATDNDDGDANDQLSDQNVWPLSHDEWDKIDNNEVRSYNADWWLRSPGPDGAPFFALTAWVGSSAGSNRSIFSVVFFQFDLRPAFQLNLESVIFTSDASGASKSGVAGSSLSAAEPPTGAIKLTVKDDVNLGLNITDTSTIVAASGSQVDIAYTSAKTGTGRSVSVIIADGSGKPLFYGRPVDCSSGNANGTASFELPSSADLPEGTYKLLVFNEEVNGANETDFASTPMEIDLIVYNPTAASLTVDNVDFGTVNEDHTQPVAKAITITNSGGTDATNVKVSLSGTNVMDFYLVNTDTSDDTVTANSTNTTWTIQPNMGLDVGIYEADITVNYSGGDPDPDTATAKVEFVVQAAPQPGEHAVTVTAQPNEGGNPTATPTNAATGTQIALEAKPNTGYTFDRWESASPGVTFDNVQAESATFPMPDNDADIVAHYTWDGDPPPTGTAPTITTDSLPDGTVGEAYSETLEADGNKPIEWRIESGNLPLGLSLSSGGVISGTPTKAGTVDFTVKAENDSGSDTQALSIKIAPNEGGGTDPGPGPGTDPGGSTDPDGGNSGGGSSSRSRSSSGSGNVRTEPKTTLPATAFSWDGRTLTIDHDSITPLGLLTVQWDGVALTRNEDYAVYQGSVIVRFGEDFMAAQSPGDHTVRVEFLNHTGEATVTVGETGLTNDELNDDLFDNNTHNPNTGGYPDGYTGATDNPNTGDGRGIWAALLLGSLSAAALLKLRPRLRVKGE